MSLYFQAQGFVKRAREGGIDVVFFGDPPTDFIFYLDQPKAVPVFTDPEALRAALAGSGAAARIVVCEASREELARRLWALAGDEGSEVSVIVTLRVDSVIHLPGPGFIAGIAHQLNNPLNNISTTAQRLLK